MKFSFIETSGSVNISTWEISDQEKMTRDVKSISLKLKSKISRLPENEYTLKKLNESIEQKDTDTFFELFRELLENVHEIIGIERTRVTIGIITTSPKEYNAVEILLKKKVPNYSIPGEGAGRKYCLGEIQSKKGNKYNLALTMTADMGNNNASTRATLLLEHFHNVKLLFLVGFAGGIPNPDKIEDHIRLGDIVVSNRYGVVQYDNIKRETQGMITFRHLPRPPSASLLEAARYLEAKEINGNSSLKKYISYSLSKLHISRPSDDCDILHDSCIQEKVISHPEDPNRRKGHPRVFIGSIASANILLRDPVCRDKLRDKLGIKAVEMEGSGISDATWNREIGYMIIRGISDYCDSFKNDDWQPYASVVAAAYMKALIESMP